MSDLPSGPVTVLFSDIEGSTSLWDREQDAMRQAHARHNEVLTQAFESHGGNVLKDKGDGFIVTFANPVKAAEAAVAAQRSLADAAWPEAIGELKVRIAINTGIVEPRDGDYYGPEINRTARLESLGHGGQILISESTRALIAGHLPDGLDLMDLGTQHLRGMSSQERVFQIVGEGLRDDFPPLRGPKRGRGLPSFANTFLGREPDKQQIVDMITDGSRLVTLLGPGGIGKTRLAVEAARDLEEIMVGGVHFADLAPLASPEQVGLAVAESVGVHPEGSVEVLSLVADTVTSPTLVLVDNFEHVIEASPSIGGLLASTPLLSLIATSRQPLALRDERLYRLEPLDISANGKPSAAVELFFDRAAAQGVNLTDSDRPAVASICERLDGLPLAIELVAARARMMSVNELDAMLSRSLDALGSGAADLPERHRTIRRAIDWSLEQLTQDQRALFTRIAALPAGGTMAMIEMVCGAGLDGPIFDDLAALVDNSLVDSVTGQAGGTRFKQLALLREYGRELLEQEGDLDPSMSRLVDYYLEVAPSLAKRLQTDSTADREVAADHSNLLAAMEWSLGGGRVEDMAEALLSMWIYWFRGDRVVDAVGWVEKARELMDSPSIDWLSGFFAFQTGDFPKLAERTTSALEGFRYRGDPHGQALALTFGALAREEPEDAYAMLAEAHELFDDSDPIGRFLALLFESIIDFQVGDLETSMSRREEVMRLSVGLEMPELIAWMHWNLALSSYGTGQLDKAADLFARAFSHMAEENYQEGVASVAVGAGLCEIEAGNLERGVTLLGAADATFERIGTVIWFEAAFHVDAARKRLEEEIGKAEFDRLHSEGHQLGFAETIDLTAEALEALTEGNA